MDSMEKDKVDTKSEIMSLQVGRQAEGGRKGGHKVRDHVPAGRVLGRWGGGEAGGRVGRWGGRRVGRQAW